MAGLGSSILPCCLYFVYAASYVIFVFLLGLKQSSEIYSAVVHQFVESPWHHNPRLSMRDVNNGNDVYDWMENVVLNTIYADSKQVGDEYYCSPVYPCLLNEGPAQRENTCAKHLVKGERNCPMFMGSGSSCCEPCTNASAPCGTTTLQLAGCSTTATTEVNNLGTNCADTMPSWLPLLANWPNNSGYTLPDALTECPSNSSHIDFNVCPERLTKEPKDPAMRPKAPRALNIANFNQLVFGRMTMKRRKLVTDTAAAFINAYPQHPKGAHVSAFDKANNDNRDSFGKDTAFTYDEDGGFRRNGGFVQYLDFNKSEREIRNEIRTLKQNYWFDLYQGSFVLELLLFNGNYQSFLYVQFAFEHLYNGMSEINVNAYPLNMSISDSDDGFSFYLRYIMLALMIAGLLFFLKSELDDMSAEPVAYFSNAVNVLHIASMSLSFVGLVYWFVTVYSYAYGDVALPFPQSAEGKLAVFSAIVDLATNMHIWFVVMSLNICLIIMRSITLLAKMTPYSNVIFATLARAQQDMNSFLLVFVTLFIGFTFGGFYLCGTRIMVFQSVSMAFVTCLQMVMGFSNYDNIIRGDPVVGIGYFYGFHLFFIITQNILLSIICGAYNEERSGLDNPDVANKFPLRRFVRTARMSIREYSRGVMRVFATIGQFLVGSGTSGSAIRVNTESLYKLQDQRAGSRPRKRVVHYDHKEDDLDKRFPDTDMKLSFKRPLYRNGLMNYYIEDVTSEGLASEADIKKGFRLVCISRSGTPDRRDFRTEKEFKEKYHSDPQELLAELKQTLPVQLEFEGRINMVSTGCCWTAFFVFATVLFFMFATRVTDSFYMFATQSSLLQDTRWSAYNPTRLMGFDQIDQTKDFEGWMAETVLERQFSCVRRIGRPIPCARLGDNDLEGGQTGYVRPDWALYAGPNGIQEAGPVRGIQFTPQAVQGQSLGYVPWSGTWGGEPGWSTQMYTVPRLRDLNVGFMKNNFVRVTMQFACFKENKRPQFANGYPFILNSVAQSSNGCATDDCMKRMIKELTDDGKPCLTFDGNPRDPRHFEGVVSTINYSFSEIGTFNKLGGFSIGLGATAQEAKVVMDIAKRDSLLSGAHVNSIVVEYVVYNDNLDMFSYITVQISVLATGHVKKYISVTSFPIVLFSMGSGIMNKGQRVMCIVLMGIFVFCVFMSIVAFLSDILIQIRIDQEMQKPAMYFLFSFFSESWWNFLDLTTIIVNVFTIYSLVQFILIDAKGTEPWVSWTTDGFKFDGTVTESTTDPYENFALAAYYYRCFTTGGGFSTLLICTRSIKYFVIIQQMQLVIMTIIQSFWELYYMLLILCLSLMAFAFMFHLRFAIEFVRFQTISRSFCELFLYMVGVFDTTPVYEAAPTYFLLTFTCVQFVFYFLLSNMFLATMVYKWKDVRKDAQDDIRSTWGRIVNSVTCCKKKAGPKGEEVKKRALDKSFWKECSVLQYLDRFDEYGKIREASKDKSNPDGTGAPQKSAGNGSNMELEEIFRRAHMEIASKMCRTTVARSVDRGGGMGNIMDEDPQDNVSEEESNDYVGIIEAEDMVEDATAQKIKEDLERKFLQEESHAWEIWLDALTTVLEDHDILEKLQMFFLPPRMLKPKSSQEWGHFDQRKVKMEKRLDLFLGLMLEETYIAHYRYLRESAKTKQKVLKQQSLVLADYLDQLDLRIRELQEQIKVLDRRNNDMRSHVQPLL